MGISYQVILIDGFDWAYANRTKEDARRYYVKYGEILAEWDQVIVLDIGKNLPELIHKELMRHCDVYYVRDDLSEWRIYRGEEVVVLGDG